jgi:hypothetical protein
VWSKVFLFLFLFLFFDFFNSGESLFFSRHISLRKSNFKILRQIPSSVPAGKPKIKKDARILFDFHFFLSSNSNLAKSSYG